MAKTMTKRPSRARKARQDRRPGSSPGGDLKTLTIEYRRPWVYPKQREAIFHKKRYGIIEASTKSGKTVGCMIWIVEQALQMEDGQSAWWVAPTLPVAKIAYRRLKKAIPKELYTSNDSETYIKLVNGAMIWFKGADRPDTLYGEDVYAAVIDEATRCKEEAWHAVRSTLTATRGPIRIIGNVKGRKNWAYRLARRAEAGAKNMRYMKLTAWDAVDAGVLRREEIEDAQAQLPENVFRELYLAEPSDDGGNPFNLEAIRKCKIEQQSDKETVAYGLDLAKSVDWTVLIGLDENGDETEYYRWQLPWRETIARVKRIVGKKPCLVDSTGVGDPILEELQADGGRNFEGYKFNPSSKQKLMEGLAVSIQAALKGEREIGIYSETILQELETFEYEYTRTGVRYTAPEGLHDDCVCALALAREMLVQQLRGRRRVGVYFPGMEEAA